MDIDATFPLEAAAAELHYIGKTNPALELARKSIAVVWEANQQAAAGDGGKDVKASDDENEQVGVHVGSGDNVKDNHGDAKRVDESKTGAEVANAAAAEDDDVKDNDGDTKRVDESKTGAADDDDVKDRAGEAERVAERETSAEVGDAAAAGDDDVKDKGGDAERVDASKTGAEVENAITAGDDDVKDNHGDAERVGESDDVGAEVADESSKMLNGGGAKVNDESKIHKEPGDDEATGSLAVATGIDDR